MHHRVVIQAIILVGELRGGGNIIGMIHSKTQINVKWMYS